MAKDYLKELNNQAAVINNFDLLQKIGVWDHLDSLNTKINDLEELIEEAGEIFNKQSINELVDYVTVKLQNKFIPSYLAIVIQEQIASDKASIICFKNMKRIDPAIDIPSLEPYKHFFSLSPQSLKFPVFEYMVGNPTLTDVFHPINPEIIMPIMGLDGVYGFFVVGKKILEDDYTDQEINYINVLIKFVSIALQNNIHYKRAITDFKTHLYNHSFFMIRIEEELARVRRYNTEMALLITDVDKFKNFNDTYGHLAGDEVLIYISQVLRESIREEDVAARFGGEEFVLMLVQCDEDSAWRVAERIRKKIEDLTVTYEEHKLHVTISIGLSHVTGQMADEIAPADLLEQADVALYNSKETGRNRTTIYLPGMKGEGK